MKFALEYLADVTDDDSAPALPLVLDDGQIAELVRYHLLTLDDVGNPEKVVTAPANVFAHGLESRWCARARTSNQAIGG
jgi:hypothetical protein